MNQNPTNLFVGVCQELEIKNGKANIFTPYNPDFVGKIKRAGGRWNPADKCWSIDARDVETARKIMREVYGRDDQPTELVSVKVSLPDGARELRGPVVIFGRVVASASGRDSGARIGNGVSFIRGGADSGGSMKNWTTVISPGSEIIIHDVPQAIADEDHCPHWCKFEGIIEESPIDIEALRAEKERLLARIAEIDKMLGQSA